MNGAEFLFSGPSTSYMRDRDARRGVSSGGVLERVCISGGSGGIGAQWNGGGAMATLGGYAYEFGWLCIASTGFGNSDGASRLSSRE